VASVRLLKHQYLSVLPLPVSALAQFQISSPDPLFFLREAAFGLPFASRAISSSRASPRLISQPQVFHDACNHGFGALKDGDVPCRASKQETILHDPSPAAAGLSSVIPPGRLWFRPFCSSPARAADCRNDDLPLLN